LPTFADALYAAQRFPEAAQRYQQLSDLLRDRPGMDLALFRLAMSQLHVPETKKRARIQLQQIQNAFPQTEGGVRALLKQTDLDFTAKKIPARKAEEVYGKYAMSRQSWSSSCEKKALLNKPLSTVSQAKERRASINAWRPASHLSNRQAAHREATALLIQQLPDVVKQQVKNKDYVKALVLTKQNKHDLFPRMDGYRPCCIDLGRAYSKLGMAEQTSQTYQYLF
jgi:hypothetical protein